jgi:eukaryotic-like serine/threonine-protein kinase
VGKTHFHRVKTLFDSLLDLSEEERAALLSQSKTHGDATRRYVADLLSEDAALAGHTARPLLPRSISDVSKAAAERARVGQTIGAFEIQQELGQGGMGSVYLARRSDGAAEQRVAIKIVRPERLDQSSLSRFRLERQVLALLNHPNIASLIDLGELDDGAPYVVMEYVEGLPITDFVSTAKSTLEQRLELFLQVCDAVQHAHRNLIVHRDIKPSNVLVDAAGRPKLIDFGIAKPLAARIGIAAYEETQTRKQVFSISNVAPEYLVDGVSGISSDVYALGVLLYELLAEEKPYQFEGLGLAQIERLVVERDPDLPSTRLATAEERRPGSPANEGRLLFREVRGDLDSIVMRCLRKRPKERYETVAELVDDINRYRNGFPVLARRGGRTYRIRRFIRRNRFPIMATAVVGILAIATSMTYLIQRSSTIVERARADQLLSLMRTALTSVDPGKSLDKDISAREVFERVATSAERSTELDPRSRSTLLAAVAEITTRIGEPKQALHVFDSVDFGALDSQSGEEARQARANAFVALGDAESASRVIAEGERQALDDASKARWKYLEASLDLAQGRLAEAAEIALQLSGTHISDDFHDEARMLLARAYDGLDHPVDAFHLYSQVLSDQQLRLPPEHPAMFRTWLALAHIEARAGLKSDLGDPATEALAIGEHLYGRRSTNYLELLKIRRDLYGNEPNVPKQRDVQLEIVSLTEEIFGAETGALAAEKFSLADVTRQSGKWAEAAAIYEVAIALAARVLPPSDPGLFKYRVVYASSLVRYGFFVEAKSKLEIALHDVDQNPDVKGLDLYAIAVLGRDICAYKLKSSIQNRHALNASILQARSKSRSPPAKTTTAFLEEVARNLGVATAAGE